MTYGEIHNNDNNNNDNKLFYCLIYLIFLMFPI